MTSLVPANTKKSTLILGMLRPYPDLVIVIVGVITTIALLMIVGSNSPIWILILCLLPMFVGVLLVVPIPQYHNTLCALQSIMGYYNSRKKYIWRGWCTRYEYEKNEQRQR